MSRLFIIELLLILTVSLLGFILGLLLSPVIDALRGKEPWKP